MSTTLFGNSKDFIILYYTITPKVRKVRRNSSKFSSIIISKTQKTFTCEKHTEVTNHDLKQQGKTTTEPSSYSISIFRHLHGSKFIFLVQFQQRLSRIRERVDGGVLEAKKQE